MFQTLSVRSVYETVFTVQEKVHVYGALLQNKLSYDCYCKSKDYGSLIKLGWCVVILCILKGLENILLYSLCGFFCLVYCSFYAGLLLALPSCPCLSPHFRDRVTRQGVKGGGGLICKVTLFCKGEGDWCSDQWGSLVFCFASLYIVSAMHLICDTIFVSLCDVDRKVLYIIYS